MWGLPEVSPQAARKPSRGAASCPWHPREGLHARKGGVTSEESHSPHFPVLQCSKNPGSGRKEGSVHGQFRSFRRHRDKGSRGQFVSLSESKATGPLLETPQACFLSAEADQPQQANVRALHTHTQARKEARSSSLYKLAIPCRSGLFSANAQGRLVEHWPFASRTARLGHLQPKPRVFRQDPVRLAPREKPLAPSRLA